MSESQSAKLMSVIVSIFTSAFTLTLLYNFCTQKEIWFAIFVYLDAYIRALQTIITKCCYTRQEENDVDRVTLFDLTVVMQITITFVTVNLLLDILTFFISITHMKWYDYINIIADVIFFIIVLIRRIAL